MPALSPCAAVRALVVVLTASAAACRASEASFGLAPSFMPNLGLAASAAVPVDALGPWHLEARFTDQFLDDKTFADNGFPAAGNWAQLDLGVFRAFAPEAERTWTARFGLVGFEARGEPNLADDPGDYWGVYAGAGRFLRVGRGLWLGPELTLVVATGPDPRVVIPQITWGLRWTPGAGRE